MSDVLKSKHVLFKTIILMIIDCLLLNLVWAFSYALSYNRFDFSVITDNLNNGLIVVSIYSVFIVILHFALGLYKSLWKFASSREIAKILIAAGIETAFLTLLCGLTIKNIRFSFVLLLFFMTLTMLFVSRFLYKILLSLRASWKSRKEKKKNVMIIGAGSASAMLIRELNSEKKMNKFAPKCIIDDDPSRKGTALHDIRIVGDRNAIIDSANKYNIDEIWFSIPSCPTQDKTEILNICKQTDCTLKIIPGLEQIINGEAHLENLRKVQIEDLLGRDPIKMDLKEVADFVRDKVVLVTGGGGSIGSELCRQIASYKPKQLIIFDVYENNAYDIRNELIHNYPELNLETLIGSVRDHKRIEAVFEKYRPQIVYHAAAHKHVPLMEDSPNEAVKNNVFGTYKTAAAADMYGAEKFVLISTDKAVNPTNVMGASKRMCEMVVQYFNDRSETDYVAVRFGNVLGSNGSVIPLFKKQIEQGGPVTVTDKRIIRYFMTIPEAVSLVLQAGTYAKGGEIFVLDMGKPVKILDLAENLIRLSGYTPYEDIKIEFTGLRPGEKLYEELLVDTTKLKRTENNLIFIENPAPLDGDEFKKKLDNLYNVMLDDSIDIRALIRDFVPTYITPEQSKAAYEKAHLVMYEPQEKENK